MAKGIGLGTLQKDRATIYAVHCPANDDYLAVDSGALTEWHKHPSKAKKFKSFEQACAATQRLCRDKQRAFWVCVVKDLGSQLQVEQKTIFSLNPNDIPLD